MLEGVLQRSHIIPSLQAGSKRQALMALAEHAAPLVGMSAREIFEAVRAREQLGCTGMGQGFCIPHARFKSLKQVHGFFANMARPIDFDADDGEPVDLIFLILAPDTAHAEHLRVLSRVAKILRDPGSVMALRKATSIEEIYQLFTSDLPLPAAS